jgi:cytochrome c-type biogenesis protein CcmE
MTTTTPAEDLSPIAPAAPRRATRSAKLRLGVVLGLIALAVGVLLYEGLLSSLNYFDTVDQALDHRASIGTTAIRLEGVVVPHTVKVSAVGTDFTISGSDGRTIRVVDAGSPPQLFQPKIPVVVVGHFASATSDVFDSNQILVKHTATYIAAHPGRVKAPNGSVR